MVNARSRERARLWEDLKSAERLEKWYAKLVVDARIALYKFDDATSDLINDRQILFDSIRDQKTSQAKYDLFNALLAHMKRLTDHYYSVYRDSVKGGISVKIDGKIPTSYRRAFNRLADRVNISEHTSCYDEQIYTTTRYIFNVPTRFQKRALKKKRKSSKR